MSGEYDDLVDACRAKPASEALHRTLIAELDKGQDPAVSEQVVTSLEIAPRSKAVRVMLGDHLIVQGYPGEALDWYQGDDPDLMVKQACALIDMGEFGKASKIYFAAVEADPSVTDEDVAKRFKGKQGLSQSADVIDLTGRLLSAGKALPIVAPPEPMQTKRFSDIGGLTEVKDQIRRRIIMPFQKKSLFDKFKKRAGGGILFYGPPGCGKTLIAKATAGECEAQFFPIRIPDVLDMYIGESEKHLAGIFEAARKKTPAVIFFDEIEALAAKRRFDTNASQSSLVSTFLSEMDGFGTNNKDILVLAATNVPWAIDSAFRRPGRFDRVMFIPPPDVEARAEILKLLVADRPAEAGLNLRTIAELTSGFSGADLRALVDEATDFAIDDSLESNSDQVTPISMKHLKEAAKARKATTIEWLTSARNYAKYNNEGGLYDDVVAFLDKHTK